jgi:RNA polymerase sigma-70 factor (ECF subfamily)
MESDEVVQRPNSSAPGGAGQPAQAVQVDPSRWVERHGDCLFGYALVRVRDASTAEDLVQETFLSALKANFAGRSSERSWLVGILKNKIVDLYRKTRRESPFTDLEFLKDEQSDLFYQEGLHKDHWIADRAPVEWPEPGADLDRAEFWDVFHKCAGKLPKKVSQVFLLRELDDTDTAEICKLLDISPSNVWVMLHRARMALRRCLETNWFNRQAR